jgi:eukaryotic-like serine/threonine-protein kinase
VAGIMEIEEPRERPESAFLPGGRVGPYRLHELINSGGMAELWLADDADGRSFALRLMHDRLKWNLTSRRRFARGCDILSKIHHAPAIINYLSHGKVDGHLYLAVEYIEGANLKQMQQRDDPVVGENVAQILLDMAAGLEQVHDAGFMHLDFKPENVMVTRNATVKLVDFDLALPRGDKPHKLGKYGGTPVYMAPEILRKDTVDHRADIFSFGVTAYELLTQQRPFPGDTPEEVARRMVGNGYEPVSLREINDSIPPALEQVVLKCLERDPDQRYPWMSVLNMDLRKAVELPG